MSIQTRASESERRTVHSQMRPNTRIRRVLMQLNRIVARYRRDAAAPRVHHSWLGVADANSRGPTRFTGPRTRNCTINVDDYWSRAGSTGFAAGGPAILRISFPQHARFFSPLCTSALLKNDCTRSIYISKCQIFIRISMEIIDWNYQKYAIFECNYICLFSFIGLI